MCVMNRGALTANMKSFGDRFTPFFETLRPLRAVERAVDFDRAEFLCGKGQFVVLWQPGGEENPAPGGVTPSGNADADFTLLGHGKIFMAADDLFSRFVLEWKRHHIRTGNF